MIYAAIAGYAAAIVMALLYARQLAKAKDALHALEKSNGQAIKLSEIHESYVDSTRRQIKILNGEINELQEKIVAIGTPADQRDLLGSLLQAPSSNGDGQD